MDRSKIKELIEELNRLKDKCTNYEFYVAIYILLRYGTFTFDKYINNTELEKIYKEIQNRRTLFDEKLNYKMDQILNEEN